MKVRYNYGPFDGPPIPIEFLTPFKNWNVTVLILSEEPSFLLLLEVNSRLFISCMYEFYVSIYSIYLYVLSFHQDIFILFHFDLRSIISIFITPIYFLMIYIFQLFLCLGCIAEMLLATQLLSIFLIPFYIYNGIFYLLV
jgi:hypothetical protein